MFSRRCPLQVMIVTAFVAVALPVHAIATPPSHLWSKRFGISSDQYGTSVTIDAAGNAIVAGTFAGTINLGGAALTSAGGRDIFVAKYGAFGNHLWSARFGDASDQFAQAVTRDGSGNVIITGYFSGQIDFGFGALTCVGGPDIFLAKFDSGGSPLWAKSFGNSSNQFGNAVTTDGSGNVLLAGQIFGAANFGGATLTSAGLADIFLAKFDPNGSHLWSKRYGDANDSRGFGVATDGSGNVVVVGGFAGTVNFGGGALVSAGSWDAYAAKLDASGGHLWSKRYGDASDQYVNAVAIDATGNVALTGLLAGSADFGGGVLTSAGDYDVFVTQLSAGGAHQWSNRFGDAALQWASSVTTDGSNVVITGYHEGSVDFGGGALTGAGSNDVFVARFNVSGVHQWSKSFGDSKEQLGFSVAADAGDGSVAVVGALEGSAAFGVPTVASAGQHDIFIAKFYSDGNHYWSKALGEGGDQYVTSVATDLSGNVIVAGSFQGTLDLGGGPLTSAGGFDVFVAGYDVAGVHLWSKRFGDDSSQNAQSVTTDASGNIIVTGYFLGGLDFGGGALSSDGGDVFVAKLDVNGAHLWSKDFGDFSYQLGNDVATDASGNVILTGQFTGGIDFGGGTLTSAGAYDNFVAKFDAAGAHLWSKRFGDANDSRGFSVATDASSNVVIAGGFRSTIDFGGGALVSGGEWDAFVAKLDPAGAHLWSRRFGDSADQYGNAVATDASGNVVLTGLLAGTADFGGGLLTSAGDYDVFVASFNAAGVHQWSNRSGDAAEQWASSVATDGAGSVFVTGYIYGSADFGGGSLSSAGGRDIFIAMFNVAGFHNWSQRFGDASDQSGFAIATDANEGLIVAGGAAGTINFGGAPLVSSGLQDAVVAKFYGTLSGVSDPGLRAISISSYPNPFNPETTIQYTVPSRGRVTVEVFDVTGARVRVLVDATSDAGSYDQAWNGRDERGQAVGSGVYFARITVARETRSYKMLLLK